MEPFPPTPWLSDAPPGLFEQGHLWIQEWVVGAPLRFQVTDAGLRFGDADVAFEPWAEPAGYRFAAALVREQFDDVAFGDAVADPQAYTFLGIATRYEGLDYDWARLPGFLGVDVHAPDGGIRSPDVAERAFERLGLTPVNAVAKELPARDIRPERYDHPASAWYDGPAAGVLARNKAGGRAVLRNPAVDLADPEPVAPESLVDRRVTDDLVDRVAGSVGEHATVERTLDRLVALLVREHYAALGEDVEAAAGAIRSAAAEPVARRHGQ